MRLSKKKEDNIRGKGTLLGQWNAVKVGCFCLSAERIK